MEDRKTKSSFSSFCQRIEHDLRMVPFHRGDGEWVTEGGNPSGKPSGEKGVRACGTAIHGKAQAVITYDHKYD
jgi:hypothetical protein